MQHKVISLALLTSLLCKHISGHGYLYVPPSRNYVAYLAGQDYNKNELNAGGPGTVYDGGLSWPNGKHGICGGAWPSDADKYMQRGVPTMTYTAGDIISFDIDITAHHMGRLSFAICPDAEVTEACFAAHPLIRTNVSSQFYYLPIGSSAGRFEGIKYRLPSDLSCEKCVLRWYYLTGNSCQPPCDAASPDLRPDGTCAQASVGVCGAGGASPEEFWNCADIQIKPRTGTLPPAPSVSVPPPSLSPSPLLSPSPPSSRPPSPSATLSPSPSPTPAYSPSPSCPIPVDTLCGSKTGMYPNPCDSTCMTYVNCGSSTGAFQSCPTGLRFNPQTTVCDWPSNVPCGGTSPSSSPPTKASPSPSPSSSSPLPSPSPKPSPVPIPSPVLSPLPSPLPSPTELCNTGTNAQRAECFCQAAASGLYADQQNGCTAFFTCYPGGSGYTLCQAGLLFDNSKQSCNWANQVSCAPSPPSPPLSPSPPPKSPSPPPAPTPPPLPPGSVSSVVGFWHWTWSSAPTPPQTNLDIAFSGWTDPVSALRDSASIYPQLKGQKYLSLGGGNVNGLWTIASLSTIDSAIQSGSFSAYNGIVYDIEEGDNGLAAAFAASFAVAKSKGLGVLVTVSHSRPYGIDDANELMASFFTNSNIDILSPQIYSSGNEAANDYTAVGVPWSAYSKAKALFVPSIVKASYYADAVSYFQQWNITCGGFIQWSQTS